MRSGPLRDAASSWLAFVVALACGLSAAPDGALFAQVRAAAPASPASATASIASPRFELRGVVMGGDIVKALIREPTLTDGHARWIEVGEQLGDYTLTSIQRDRVELEAEGESIAVLLSSAPPPAASPVRRASGPSPIAEFLAWRTGTDLAEIQARLRAGTSWLTVAREYGLEPAAAVREYGAWRRRR